MRYAMWDMRYEIGDRIQESEDRIQNKNLVGAALAANILRM